MSKPKHTREQEHPDAWMDEPDIGSGEKTPGEHETEAIVRSVPPNRQGTDAHPGAAGGRQDGTRQGGGETGKNR
jgi:hypothetical protein